MAYTFSLCGSVYLDSRLACAVRSDREWTCHPWPRHTLISGWYCCAWRYPHTPLTNALAPLFSTRNGRRLPLSGCCDFRGNYQPLPALFLLVGSERRTLVG